MRVIDEIEIKRAMRNLVDMIKEVEDGNTRAVFTVMLAVLIEHNKSIVELVDAGDY